MNVKLVRLSTPEQNPAWKIFYEKAFAPVNDSINAKDVKAFEAAYTAVIQNCNGCHKAMGYGFINVVKLGAPADSGVDYKVKSNPGDVPP